MGSYEDKEALKQGEKLEWYERFKSELKEKGIFSVEQLNIERKIRLRAKYLNYVYSLLGILIAIALPFISIILLVPGIAGFLGILGLIGKTMEEIDRIRLGCANYEKGVIRCNSEVDQVEVPEETILLKSQRISAKNEEPYSRENFTSNMERWQATFSPLESQVNSSLAKPNEKERALFKNYTGEVMVDKDQEWCEELIQRFRDKGINNVGSLNSKIRILKWYERMYYGITLLWFVFSGFFFYLSSYFMTIGILGVVCGLYSIFRVHYRVGRLNWICEFYEKNYI